MNKKKKGRKKKVLDFRLTRTQNDDEKIIPSISDHGKCGKCVRHHHTE